MTTTDQVESAIRTLEDDRYGALTRGDIDVFATLCHPDLVYTHSSGETDGRDSYLAKLRDGYYVYHSVEHPVSRIVVNGDVALVLGEMHADITVNGLPKVLHCKCLAVWARLGTEWRFLAYQPTPLPQR